MFDYNAGRHQHGSRDECVCIGRRGAQTAGQGKKAKHLDITVADRIRSIPCVAVIRPSAIIAAVGIREGPVHCASADIRCNDATGGNGSRAADRWQAGGGDFGTFGLPTRMSATGHEARLLQSTPGRWAASHRLPWRVSALLEMLRLARRSFAVRLRSCNDQRQQADEQAPEETAR